MAKQQYYSKSSLSRDEKDALVRATCEFLRKQSRDTLISYSTIKNVLNFHPSQDYEGSYMMAKVRKLLRQESKLILQTVHKQGYKLALDSQIVDGMGAITSKIHNSINTGLEMLIAVNPSNLNSELQVKYNRDCSTFGALKMITSERVQQHIEPHFQKPMDYSDTLKILGLVPV